MVGVALASCGIFVGVGFQHYFYHTLATGQMITADLNQLLFSQSLRLSLQARGKSQVGDIVNHMSSDADTVSDFPIILGDLAWATIVTLSVSVLLFVYIGWSAAPALMILFLLVPMTQRVAKKFVKYDEQMSLQRDRRVTLISQILQSIRVVKYFSWEKAVTKEVRTIRENELSSREKLAHAEVVSGVSYLAVGSLVLFVALWVHVLRGQILDAATIFTCLSLFSLLEEPFGHLSRHFSRLTQAIVSTARIQKFLKQDNIESSSSLETPTSGNDFELEDVSFYHADKTEPVLKNIHLTIQRGQSVAIVGPVGAGKSSLLYGLLGECRISQGQFRKRTDLFGAYVPQEAYIVNSSLLENLTFGSLQASPEFLRKCIHASCLDKDIRDLPAGLRTEIGEKGVNLSGGQKQRVSLARAALIEPQVVFLDDPLSAVDVETEKILCDRLLFGLWDKITRIVVTHRLESLGQFDQIIFLKDGEIKAQGTLTELKKNSAEFMEFYIQTEDIGAHSKLASLSTGSEAAVVDDNSHSRITDDEEREKGVVKSTVYWDYISSLGGKNRKRNLFRLGIGALVAASMPLLQKWWLAFYSDHQGDIQAQKALLIFGGIGILVLVTHFLNQIFWLKQGIGAGRDMHERMLKSILKAPIRFFDSTPVGRILQRFSRDIESVDIYLQWSFDALTGCLLQVFISLILILAVLPPMLVIIFPALFIYYRLQQDYRRPAREAKRLDSIARSPRYAHFKETLLGLPVIRAFQRQDWFLSQFYERLRHSQRMFYGHYMLNRWFSSRIPLVGGLISISTVCGAAVAVRGHWLEPGMGGLITIYSLSFWAQLNWGVRIFADIESRMTSVERLKFYSSLPSEGGTETADHIPHQWPRLGQIRWENVKARYADHLPWVLKGVSFEIPAGKKVGIIGRTGSGKSTLFQVLYRFLEIDEGSIYLDGVDLKSVPLEKLRRSLAIVPQDPSLFLGTLKSNIDRYSECSEIEIWESLRKTGLEKFVRTLPLGLETPVQENGANLSQGQRQLLCLARALLIKAKVILMDEATASVDVQTDQMIQRVIRESLKDTTMLIIAHRLETVRDCDQVIEMADGQVQRISRSSDITIDLK